MKRTPRRLVLGALVTLGIAAAVHTTSHLRTPSSYGVTARTLPCVDVTVHVTQPPPHAYVCPPF